MLWFVYILLCDNKIYYVGITDDIHRRFSQHQKHQSFYTKQFKEIKLVYTEPASSRKEAEKRESQIKKWSIAKKKALIRGDFELLKKLSKGHEIGESSLR